MPNNLTLIFKEINGLWQAVDSANSEPLILCEFLHDLNIIIDDNTQFCRIIRYYCEYKETITYRAYNNAKITITLNYCKYE